MTNTDSLCGLVPTNDSPRNVVQLCSSSFSLWVGENRRNIKTKFPIMDRSAAERDVCIRSSAICQWMKHWIKYQSYRLLNVSSKSKKGAEWMMMRFIKSFVAWIWKYAFKIQMCSGQQGKDCCESTLVTSGSYINLAILFRVPYLRERVHSEATSWSS